MMKRWMKSIFLFLTMVLLTACGQQYQRLPQPYAQPQAQSQALQVQSLTVDLRVGFTTKAEVLNVLGVPNRVEMGMFGKVQGERLSYDFYSSTSQRKVVVVRIIAKDGTVYEGSRQRLTVDFADGILYMVQ